MKKLMVLSLALALGLASTNNSVFAMKKSQALQQLEINFTALKHMEIDVIKGEATKETFLKDATALIDLMSKTGKNKKEIASLAKEIKALSSDKLTNDDIVNLLLKIGNKYEAIVINSHKNNAAFKLALLLGVIIIFIAIIITHYNLLGMNNVVKTFSHCKTSEQGTATFKEWLNCIFENAFTKKSF